MTASGSVVSQTQEVKASIDEFVQILSGDFDQLHGIDLIEKITNCLNRLMKCIDLHKKEQLSVAELKLNIDKSIELLCYLDQVPEAKIKKAVAQFDDLREIINTSILSTLDIYRMKFLSTLQQSKDYESQSAREGEEFKKQFETIYTDYLRKLAAVRDYYLQRLRIKMDSKQYQLCKEYNDLILQMTSDGDILEDYIDNQDLDESALEDKSTAIKNELQDLAQLNTAVLIGDAIASIEHKQQKAASITEAVRKLQKTILKIQELKQSESPSCPPSRKAKLAEKQQAAVEVKSTTEVKEKAQGQSLFSPSAGIDLPTQLLQSRQVIAELDATVKELKASDENMEKWLFAVWIVCAHDYKVNLTDFDQLALELQAVINIISQYIARNHANKASSNYMAVSMAYYDYIISFGSMLTSHFYKFGYLYESYVTCKTVLGYCNTAMQINPEMFKKNQESVLKTIHQVYEENKKELITARSQAFDLGKEVGDFTSCSLIVKHIDDFVQFERPSVKRSAADDVFLQENRKVLTDIADYTQQELQRLKNDLRAIFLRVIKIPVKDASAPDYDDMFYRQQLDLAIDKMFNGLRLSLPMYRQLVKEAFHPLPKKGLPLINLPVNLGNSLSRVMDLYTDARAIVDAAKAAKSDKKRAYKDICDKKHADAENNHLLFLKLVIEPEDTILAPGYKRDHFVEELKLLTVNTITKLQLPFKEVNCLIQRLPKLTGIDAAEIKLDIRLSVFKDFCLKANAILVNAKLEKQQYQRVEKERVDSINLQKFKRALVNTLTYKVVIPEDDGVKAPGYSARKYKKEIDALVDDAVNKITVTPENPPLFISQLPIVNGVKNGEEKLTAEYLLIDFYRQARVIVDTAERDKKQCIKKLLDQKKLMQEKALKEQRLKDVTEIASAIATSANSALVETKVTIDFQINAVDESVEFIFIPGHGSPAFIYHDVRIMKKDFFENVIAHQLKDSQLIFEAARNGQALVVKGIQKNQSIQKKMSRITSRGANFLREQENRSHELQQKLEAEDMYEKLLDGMLGEDIPHIVNQAKAEIPVDDLFESLLNEIANEEVKQSIVEAKADKQKQVVTDQTELLITDVIVDEIRRLSLLCDDHNMGVEVDQLLDEACVTDESDFRSFRLRPIQIIDNLSTDRPVDDKKTDSEMTLDGGSIISGINPSGGRVAVPESEFPTVLTATIRPRQCAFFKEKLVDGAVAQVDDVKRLSAEPA